LSTTSSKPPRAAENALWQALEERRDLIRAIGPKFSERQHRYFRQAYAAGNLIAHLCGKMANYKKGHNDREYLEAMALLIKAGLPTWEHILIREREPWTDYVTDEARRGARQCIQDAIDYAHIGAR